MTNEYREIRLQKSARLREMGVNPYAVRTPQRSTCAALLAAYQTAETASTGGTIAGEHPKLPGAAAGRILAHRAMGKNAVFMDLWDESGKMQVYVNKKSLTDTEWEILNNLDLGDIIWVNGEISRTRTGEVTLFAMSLKFLTKALAVPPLEKTGGLKDIELRSRKRYADLLAAPDKRAEFALRSRIVREVRTFLAGRGFMEVETPMMHPIPGGARARPFITHHNALAADLYLRIAPELYLKRLLVGGYERVFEINRSFRNEGIDHSHNPEFTMLELYEAYSDYHGMMELTESLFGHLAAVVTQARTGEPAGERRTLTWDGTAVDLTPPFKRASYSELFREHVGIDIHDEVRVRAKARELELPPSLGHWKLVDELFDKYVQPSLVQPTFVIDYPTVICPLTKACEDRPELCERFELFVKGVEFANAFSELNDPVEQLARFEEQVAKALTENDDESPKEVDRDYVEALEFGMPPAGGLGIGIDRLIMLLTDKHSIRDVVLFPALRREQAAMHTEGGESGAGASE